MLRSLRTLRRSVVCLLVVACDGKDGLLTAAQDSGDGEVVPRIVGSCEPHDTGCAGDALCCSDDPATVGGKLPHYFTGIVDATHDVPIFSGDNNALSTSGRCIDPGGYDTPLANGCPLPCNPTWDAARTAEICGEGTTCCQTGEIDPDKDCVVDPQSQRWRAVTGHDLGTVLTTWGDQHTSNQDPFGVQCSLFVTGGEGFVEAMHQPMLEDCFDQLTVADQRGFCRVAGECPCQEDPCAMKNADWVPTCAD